MANRNSSSHTSPFKSKSSKDDMTLFTNDNIISNIQLYSEYLNKIFQTQYLTNTDNKTSYYRKIEKKFNLTIANNPKRYNKHLILLLAILYNVSKLNFNKDVKPYIEYVMSIVSLLESSDITGWYHYYKHKTTNTYTTINNIYYFKFAKTYLKDIYNKTNIIYNEFYDNSLLKSKDSKQFYVVFISNTHVRTLLSLILNGSSNKKRRL